MILLFFATLAPILVAIIGDKLLENINYFVLRAVIDCLTHGTIGLLSWTIVLTKVQTSRNCIISPSFEAILSGFIASFIDLDHFFTARSLKLSNAMRLGEKRAPLHATSLLLVVTLPLLLSAKVLRKDLLYRLMVLVLVSVGSHHIRDGVRRGLWFPPFGSTPPIPHTLYIALIGLLPHVLSLLVPDQFFKFTPIDII